MIKVIYLSFYLFIYLSAIAKDINMEKDNTDFKSCDILYFDSDILHF